MLSSRWFGVMVVGVLLAAPASLRVSGQTQRAVLPTVAAGKGHPGNVPRDYVVTPFGYVHPSCVTSLAPGDRLLPNRRVEHGDGSTDQPAAPCGYTRYTKDGAPVSAATAASPVINGWLMNANVTTNDLSKSYGAITARWTVPPAPAADDGQVVYFFPGLEDIQNTQSILQPVLGWFAGNWYVNSWNCCLSGTVVVSPTVYVSPGDEIFGSVTTNCPGALTCASWNVLTTDLSTGQQTLLGNTPSDGQTFNWAFGGVLEPYGIVSCADFPNDSQLRFARISLFDEGLHRVTPEWSAVASSGVTPDCGYAVTDHAHEVTLMY